MTQQQEIGTINGVIANYTGLYLQLIESVWFGGQGTWNDVLAEVTGYINKKILEEGVFDSTLPDAIYYTIEMPCGHHFDFKTEADVWNLEPEKDIPCSCGDQTHYFVRWRRFEK